MSKKDLTEKQNQVLDYIRDFRQQNGYPPTLREIGKQFGIVSTYGVKRHLDALVKKGFLEIGSNSSRAITIVQQEEEVVQRQEPASGNIIPILGRVAAGSPVLSEENFEGNLAVDPSFIRNNKKCFALKVQGNSMINDGIFEGDFVIVAPGKEVANNDIVVALLEKEVTVKRFYRSGSNITLFPANPDYHPIRVDYPELFSLMGRVIGVIRWYN